MHLQIIWGEPHYVILINIKLNKKIYLFDSQMCSVMYNFKIFILNDGAFLMLFFTNTFFYFINIVSGVYEKILKFFVFSHKKLLKVKKMSGYYLNICQIYFKILHLSSPQVCAWTSRQ